ncbi:unnamed protein product, partial [marine sediment metagenome]
MAKINNHKLNKMNRERTILFSSIGVILILSVIFLCKFLPWSIALADSSPSIHFQEESWDFGDI